MDPETLECDVAVVGGGLGGCAAALAACEAGLRVIMTDPTDWIGGQVTSQGVSALDEHAWIETFGGTRSYYRFREGIRKAYIEQYGGPARMPDTRPLNPGNGWVSRLCFEPCVGLQVLDNMLAEHIESGRLMVLLQRAPVQAEVSGGAIRQVTVRDPQGQTTHLRARWYLDATDLGELLPLAQVPYASGAEARADTGEPHAAPDGAHPRRVQAFTMCFFVEYRPGEDHTIRKPRGYETWRDQQPFTLTLGRDSSERRFYMFGGDLPFWTYRRSYHAALFHSPERPYDVALINWDSNDYYKENLIDRSAAQQARIFREARRLSLSFLYWLQTEASHDGPATGLSRARGFRGLRLAPEIVGTSDGLAKAPYIREGRRLLGYRRLLEQDIASGEGQGARAAFFADSVGVGWYPLDLHRCAGDPTGGREDRLDLPDSLPFQIPLGALLSGAVNNLIAAGKCLATTHITNGAYRVHPVEWNVGESAGALAAFCSAQNVHPAAILADPNRLQAFQDALLRRGVPLNWGVDVPLADPNFLEVQACIRAAPVPPGTTRFERLQLLPEAQVSRREAAWLIGSHPRAVHSDVLRGLTADWAESPYAPFSATDWRAAQTILVDSGSDMAAYPTLRDLCRVIARSA